MQFHSIPYVKKILWNLYVKYRVVDFAPSNKSVMANDFPSTNLEQFWRQINLRLRINSAKYIAR